MSKVKAIPEGMHTITPHLVVDNAAEAIVFLQKAFGAEEMARAEDDTGQKIFHAMLRIGDSMIFVNDAFPERGSPTNRLKLWIYTEDVDALYNRAVAAGAQVGPGPMGQMQDQFWGDRSGTVIDPFGYQWTIATHKEDLTPEEMKERQDAFMKSFAGAR